MMERKDDLAAITPWNSPNAMIARKAAPPLAAGCPIIIKIAKLTPFPELAMGELAARAGAPAGVFNVITDSKSGRIRTELTESLIVRKVMFTGSTKIGKMLMQQCESMVKKMLFSLAAMLPLIVFNDVDIAWAVKVAFIYKFCNVGQAFCLCQ
jgi:succinate-semialdehyde dehydrogenase / glutarate-semialdehyde dehydrogenase